MPDLAALRPGDPAMVGAYRLGGRLGEGGQGIVYLAHGPGGGEVALKLLRADLAGNAEASERFVREVALARRVAPFCTAQVIETGLYGGRPYIVSEYIDGPTLTQVVRTEGPRSGAALHRLAVGTITALVAIHQAGIVHRDFKPSNVVLAHDGPRVIDFGIAKALDLSSTLTGAVVGTPSYMAPEQFSETGPGPESDLFAWACTLLFAASGQPPFGHDSLPAVVNRIMHTEPDIHSVADPALRTLVADCLAKDPALRPAASEALMRLLGHAPSAAGQPGPQAPGLLRQGSAAAAYPPPGPPARSSGLTGWVVAGGAVGLVALTAATAFVAVRLAVPPGRTPSPTASAGHTTVPVTRSITLPGTSVQIREREGDPIRLASYTVDGGRRLFVRRHATGAFAPDRRYFDYALNPQTNQALGTDVDYSGDHRSTVSIIDHVTGDKRLVELTPKPVFPTTPRWSPDGRYGLVTLYSGTGGATTEYGFAIIDVVSAKGRAFQIKEHGAGQWRFFWDAGGRAVGTWVEGRMKFYGLDGAPLRTLADAGAPVWVEGDDVSPDGTRFLAHCTTAGTTLCARSTSGRDLAPVTIPFASDRLIGWWDDDHLAVWRAKGTGYEAVVIDLAGRVGRVVATAARKAEFDAMGFRFGRAAW